MNRLITVTTGGLADLNEALAFAVQMVEAEKLPAPNITISAYYVLNGDDPDTPQYEVSVSGEQEAQS